MTKLRKGTMCSNHPKEKALDYCERCQKPFCEKCLIETHQDNFISHAFLAVKRDFPKVKLCKVCEANSRRNRVLFALLLLFFFVTIIVGSIFIR